MIRHFYHRSNDYTTFEIRLPLRKWPVWGAVVNQYSAIPFSLSCTGRRTSLTVLLSSPESAAPAKLSRLPRSTPDKMDISPNPLSNGMGWNVSVSPRITKISNGCSTKTAYNKLDFRSVGRNICNRIVHRVHEPSKIERNAAEASRSNSRIATISCTILRYDSRL